MKIYGHKNHSKNKTDFRECMLLFFLFCLFLIVTAVWYMWLMISLFEEVFHVQEHLVRKIEWSFFPDILLFLEDFIDTQIVFLHEFLLHTFIRPELHFAHYWVEKCLS